MSDCANTGDYILLGLCIVCLTAVILSFIWSDR